MSRRCLVTQRNGMSGQTVSHANNKSKRRFLLNLQQFSLYSDALNQNFNVRLSTRGLRTIEFHGGLDGYVKTTKNSKLDPYFKRIKKRIAAKSA
jgi:large subunit ribosomal protein L28